MFAKRHHGFLDSVCPIILFITHHMSNLVLVCKLSSPYNGVLYLNNDIPLGLGAFDQECLSLQLCVLKSCYLKCCKTKIVVNLISKSFWPVFQTACGNPGFLFFFALTVNVNEESHSVLSHLEQ